MNHRLMLLTLLACLGTCVAEMFSQVPCGEVEGDIYEFHATSAEGHRINFVDYTDKVVLIANIATYDEDTTTNFNLLNDLAEFYSSDDVVILGFPCNQFGLAEPGFTIKNTLDAIQHVRPGGDFQSLFTIFKQVQVNGDKSHDLFSFLKSFYKHSNTSFTVQNTLLHYYSSGATDRRSVQKFLLS
ncbi:unnamed protein product, partial [Meganyctiphanes norvegica]